MSKAKRVYQFKITLLDTKLPIWRRIQVAENYRFWDLHMAIQNAMGWQNCPSSPIHDLFAQGNGTC